MRTLLTVLTLVACSAGTLPATTVHFAQGGWESGAKLHVLFTGQDLDGDTFLIQSEVESFQAIWQTPAGQRSEWGLLDIQPDGLFFADLGNYLIFTRNSEFSLVNSSFEGQALASVFDEFLFPVDNTGESPTAVPEPGGLVAVGLLVPLAAWVARVRQRR